LFRTLEWEHFDKEELAQIAQQSLEEACGSKLSEQNGPVIAILDGTMIDELGYEFTEDRVEDRENDDEYGAFRFSTPIDPLDEVLLGSADVPWSHFNNWAWESHGFWFDRAPKLRICLV
jgi:hypothetical protein